MLPIRVLGALVILVLGLSLAIIYYIVSWILFGIAMMFYQIGRFLTLDLWHGTLSTLAWIMIWPGQFFKEAHRCIKDLLVWHADSTKLTVKELIGKYYSNESRKV